MPRALPPVPAHQARPRVPRGIVESRVEPARRCARRPHADARLGPCRRPRSSRGLPRHPDARSAGLVDAVDPGVLVRRGRARWLRQAARGGGLRAHRRGRPVAEDPIHQVVERHRARRALRVDPHRADGSSAGTLRYPTRGARVTSRRQLQTIGLVASIVALVVLSLIPHLASATDSQRWAQALYIGIAAMGLNILTGYNGQVSIGHGAFFGIGAYTTG